MAKCSGCKKIADLTWWETVRYDLMCRLFPDDVQSLRSEAHSRGVGDGYKLGFKAAQHIQSEDEQRKFIAELAKGELESWLKPFSE